MRKLNVNKIRHIYTFDNGAGNVIGYVLDPKAEESVGKPLTDEHGEPAGFYETPKGEIQVGRKLMGQDFKTYAINNGRMSLFIKAIPNDDNHHIMVHYLSAWLERMKKSYPGIEEDGDNAVWLIGSPTGWRSREILDRYRRIFLEAGFVNPIIVPESNAAMAHLLKSDSKMQHVFDLGYVCCLDMGAYSNDCTIIRPEKVRSYGSFVGASLIEKMIMVANLFYPEEYLEDGRSYNAPLVCEAVRKRFAEDELFQNFMLMQGRMLKEKYFTQETEGTNTGTDSMNIVMLDNDPGFLGMPIFTIFVNSRMIYDLVQVRTIRQALGEEIFGGLSKEVQEEIGDKTWKECLTAFLKRTAGEFEEFGRDASGNDPEHKPYVLLTGGGSYMNFVKSTILETFPNIHLESDLTPIKTIALGLTEFAPDKLKHMIYEDAFDSLFEAGEQLIFEGEVLLESCSPATKFVYENYLKALNDLVYEPIQVPYMKLVEAFENWAQYKCKAEDVVPKAKEAFSAFYHNEFVKKLDDANMAMCYRFQDSMNDRLSGYLKSAGYPDIKIFTENEQAIDCSELLSLCFGALFKRMNKILDTWEHVAEEMGNPGRSLFSDPRADRFKSAESQFLEWIKKEIAVTKNDMLEFALSREIMEYVHYHMMHSVWVLVDERRKTRLGELLVEETFDTEDENSPDE